MADNNRTTLLVAVAGIAATALVGVAATTAGWLSARDDRATQRALAHDEQTYNRRVAAYLDAIRFVGGQERALYLYAAAVALKKNLNGEVDPPTHFPDIFYISKTDPIPFQPGPPTSLTTRLQVFGSPRTYKIFQGTQSILGQLSFSTGITLGGEIRALPSASDNYEEFVRGYMKFYDQIDRLQDAVHDEVG